MDECVTVLYTFVMTKMSNDNENEYCDKINKFWNLKRKEKNFLIQNYTKTMISYKKLVN